MRSLVCTVLTALVSLTVACGAESNSTAEQSAALPPTADATLVHAASAEPRDASRVVAITFDDLPHARSGAHSLAWAEETTERLLSTLRVECIPAVGFVNERQIDRAERPQARVALLQAWLNAGMRLGNHTWGHPKFWDTPLAEYQDQVLRGERVTRRLMAHSPAISHRVSSIRRSRRSTARLSFLAALPGGRALAVRGIASRQARSTTEAAVTRAEHGIEADRAPASVHSSGFGASAAA